MARWTNVGVLVSALLVLSTATVTVDGQELPGPVYLSLGTVNPMITTNNTNILITTIGEDVDSLPVLTCHTDLVECCRGSDHPGTGGLGNWFNPNGDMLTNEGDGGDFYIRRNDAQLIRLNRRRSATSPVGLYCCVIPTTIGEQIFCANLVLCSLLTAPTNGGISYSDDKRGMGTVATYSCGTGYGLVGDVTRICESADTWSGTEPTCESDCAPLSDPEHGDVDTSSGTGFNSVATYSCYTGFVRTGAMTRVCGANGQWSSTAPTCIILDCGRLSDPEHGNVDTSRGTVFNTIAMYSCDEGYNLVGVSVRVCGSQGIWIPEIPSCRIVDCGFLHNPDNGQVETSSGTTYTSSATYTCDRGYILNGDVSRTCHHNQSWIPMAPVCIPLDCGPLSNPENGDVDTSAGSSLGKNATYTCDTGYRLNGSMIRSCNSSGHWDPLAPTCFPVDCGSLSHPENGRVDTSSGTIFRKVSTYSCDVGYTLLGTETRTCTESGQWFPDAPYCPIVDCGPLLNPEKGHVNTSSGTTYNSVAFYTCIEGYELVGEPERHCDPDGMWTPSAPSCVPVDCGPLRQPKNGIVNTMPDTFLKSTATYSCNPGYNLTGITQRVCQPNGSWSSSAPYCADSAMVQLKFGPTSHCVEWSESKVELMYKILHGSIFKAIVEKGGQPIAVDKINKGYFSCYSSNTRTTYRTTISGLENTSAVHLAELVQKWVESGVSMRALWYVIKIDKSCPVLISSIDDDECA